MKRMVAIAMWCAHPRLNIRPWPAGRGCRTVCETAGKTKVQQPATDERRWQRPDRRSDSQPNRETVGQRNGDNRQTKGPIGGRRTEPTETAHGETTMDSLRTETARDRQQAGEEGDNQRMKKKKKIMTTATTEQK